MSDHLEAFFLILDADSEGSLSVNQFMAGFNVTADQSMSSVNIGFTLMDADGDSALSAQEVCLSHSHIHIHTHTLVLRYLCITWSFWVREYVLYMTYDVCVGGVGICLLYGLYRHVGRLV